MRVSNACVWGYAAIAPLTRRVDTSARIGGRVTRDAFNVESVVPFRKEDAGQLARDPTPLLDKHYLGAPE